MAAEKQILKIIYKILFMFLHIENKTNATHTIVI